MSEPAFPLDQTLAALADPTRRRVVEYLRAGPRRASDLADHVAVSRPLMSRHLRILREGGLVEEARHEGDARQRIFRLRQAPFADLSDWLESIQAFWTDQLQAFKAHVEASTKETDS